MKTLSTSQRLALFISFVAGLILSVPIELMSEHLYTKIFAPNYLKLLLYEIGSTIITFIITTVVIYIIIRAKYGEKMDNVFKYD